MRHRAGFAIMVMVFGLAAVAAPAASALSRVCGYSQCQRTAFHFGCSPTHWAM